MEPIFVVVCSDGKPCSAWLDRGFWTNMTYFKVDAESKLVELDNPADTDWAKELAVKNPEGYAKLKEHSVMSPSKCSPHRIIEYRPVSPFTLPGVP